MSVGVIGAGAWGTALAIAAARNPGDVLLWGRDAGCMAAIAATRCNPALPGSPVPASIRVTSKLADAASAEILILAVPTQSVRAVCELLAELPGTPANVIAAAKGIERGTQSFVTEIIAEVLPGANPAILSGPSFAADVARGLPTAVTLAAGDEFRGAALARRLGSPFFRIYHTTDIRGVELGGAAKNVLAIAAGIVAGKRMGESARAAVIARGFAELRRLAEACGARPETLMGLSGLGDLLLSAASMQSRNYAFGFALGRGGLVAEASGGKLAEGAFTAPALAALARERNVEMPIAEGIAAILSGALRIDQVLEALVNRPQKSELS